MRCRIRAPNTIWLLHVNDGSIHKRNGMSGGIKARRPISLLYLIVRYQPAYITSHLACSDEIGLAFNIC